MKLLFVSFEPGTRGHYIARVLSSLPYVYWYSHPDNGIHPWNVHSAVDSAIRQRHVSANHFDRIVPNGKLPPTWDYVENFFPNSDSYYEKVFWPQFNKLAPNTDKYIIYCTHSMPDDLLTYFPDAKIINVTCDWQVAHNRYMNTTAEFPGYIRLADIVPQDNEWLHFLTNLKDQKKNFTVADIWAQQTYGTWFNSSMYPKYSEDVAERFVHASKLRTLSYKNTFNTTVSKFNWKAIKEFLLN